MKNEESIEVRFAGMGYVFPVTLFQTIGILMAQGNKINAIKEMRSQFVHMGLKEAKDFVEAVFPYNVARTLDAVSEVKLGLGQYALLDTLARTKQSLRDVLSSEDSSCRTARLFDLYEQVSEDYRAESDRLNRGNIGF